MQVTNNNLPLMADADKIKGNFTFLKRSSQHVDYAQLRVKQKI